MSKVIYAAICAIRSTFAQGMPGIFVKSLIITIVSLIAFIVLMSFGGSLLAGYFKDWEYASWLPWVTGIGSTIFVWFLFPGIMPLIISFFDEEIVEIIEKESYPPALAPLNKPIWKELPHDIAFALKAIGLNILCLPLYLIPFFNFFIFLGLNGYLLGNEFFLTVARRHMETSEAVKFKKQNARTVFIAGVIIAFCSIIPLVNLFSPFWGIALMTHLYHLKLDKSINTN